MREGVENLKVYQLSYRLAMHIFEISNGFPKEEKYSLTDQVRRSSRSCNIQIAEPYPKRIYPKHFVSKLSDSDGECAETIGWWHFAFSCKYISKQEHDQTILGYKEIGKMLGGMMNNPNKFLPKK